MNKTVIKVEKITKQYRSGKINIFALRDVSLEIKKGEFVILNGPSGSGKTTLLNILGLLTRITTGSLFLEDQEVSHLPDHFLSSLRKEKTGFMFQQFNLIAGYSAWENVSLPLVPMGVSTKTRKKKALKLLEELHLETRADFLANELSGGEQQRVAIARALINDPEIILADEPLSNIDENNIELVLNKLTELKKAGKTIITSFHFFPATIEGLFDRMIKFESGRII